MYLIYQDFNGDWVLRLSFRSFKKVHRFKTYIKALQAAQLLGLHANKYDKSNRFLRDRFLKTA